MHCRESDAALSAARQPRVLSRNAWVLNRIGARWRRGGEVTTPRSAASVHDERERSQSFDETRSRASEERFGDGEDATRFDGA